MSKSAKKKDKVPKITEEQYAEYILGLKEPAENSEMAVSDQKGACVAPTTK
ncbi:MAG: hypothetical protein IJX87_00055 [Clostridia bacterium]|nr:hypothetical protein [Clostridia bacterium]